MKTSTELLVLFFTWTGLLFADTPPQVINKLCSSNQFFSQIQPGPNNIQCTQPTYSGIANTPSFIDSITIGSNNVSLVNDTATPGNNKFYGTNGSGVLGYQPGGALTEATSSVLTISGGTTSVIGSGTSIQVKQATTAQSGYLSNTDWNTFNGKQGSGSYLTALTGDATASGPGSAALTLATVNANTGSFGSASSTPSFTVNGKGLITAAASNSIQVAESQVTNLVSDLAGKQATGNYITALTGDVTGSGPGSTATTLASSIAGAKTFSTSLTSPIFTSSTLNPATAGVLRLANADAIEFRNSTNNGNILLTPGSTDGIVSYGGFDLANISSAQTLSGKSISGSSNTLSNIADGSLSTSYLKADGSRALTGNWGAGAFSVTANSVAVGSSANAITNLNTISTAASTGLNLQLNGTTYGLFDSSGRWALGRTSAQTNSALAVGNRAIATNANTVGVYTDVSSGTGGSGFVTGFFSDATTAAQATTYSYRAGFFANNATRGAGSSLTNDVAFLGTATQGTNNAVLADSTNFTGGTWFINEAGTAASTFGGNITAPTFIGALTGNASTATALQTPRTINGVSFDGSANITVPAAAGTLTGTTLNSTVVSSSLTSVGTLTSLAVTGTISGSNLSGTNTGDVSLAAVGSSPSANGATLSGQALTLQPADNTHPGLLSTAAQTIAGAKSLSSNAAIGLTSVNSSSILRLGNTLTGVNSYGVLADFTGTTSQTNTIAGFVSDLSNTASAYTTSNRFGFYHINETKGAGSSIGNDVAFYSTIPSQGTFNAILSDNLSGTGSYGINLTSANKNLLTGATAIGGTTTNDNASAGFVGEAVRANVVVGSAITITGTVTWQNITSISLTAGDWDVSGIASFGVGTGTGLTNIRGAISINSGTTITDQVWGDNMISTPSVPTGSSDAFLPIPSYRISLSGTTTVYLKGYCNFSGGAPVFYGRISARRAR